jgi:hypothetical protein
MINVFFWRGCSRKSIFKWNLTLIHNINSDEESMRDFSAQAYLTSVLTLWATPQAQE